MEPPVCFGCKQKCVIRISKGENRNYGRRFWACQRSLRGGSCVRWNGWIDPMPTIKRKHGECFKCCKHINTLTELHAQYDALSGFILTHEPLRVLLETAIRDELEKGTYVCCTCEKKDVSALISGHTIEASTAIGGAITDRGVKGITGAIMTIKDEITYIDFQTGEQSCGDL
jgi:hypothetical protein